MSALQLQQVHSFENSFQNSFPKVGHTDPVDNSHPATHVLDRWCSKGVVVSQESVDFAGKFPVISDNSALSLRKTLIRNYPLFLCLAFKHQLYGFPDSHLEFFNCSPSRLPMVWQPSVDNLVQNSLLIPGSSMFHYDSDCIPRQMAPSQSLEENYALFGLIKVRGCSLAASLAFFVVQYDFLGRSLSLSVCHHLYRFLHDRFEWACCSPCKPRLTLQVQQLHPFEKLPLNSFSWIGRISHITIFHPETHVLDRWCSMGVDGLYGLIEGSDGLPWARWISACVSLDLLASRCPLLQGFSFNPLSFGFCRSLSLCNGGFHPKLPYEVPHSNLSLCECIRIGEAKNPGPRELSIKSCNPTTIANKKEEFRELLPGIIGISESAATKAVQVMMMNQFAELGLSSRWSIPVSSYSSSSANMRGVAGGTAILSPFPVRDSCETKPEDIQVSNRICETHVQFMPNRFMYVASLYGPTDHFKYGDPIQLLNRLFGYAAQKACRFVGPAVIMGDLNAPLSRLDLWPALQAQGWVDAGEMSALLNGHPLEMTYFEDSRHTFILVNPILRKALIQCRTTAHHLFAGHPVLDAIFDIENIITPVQVWRLPKSFDSFLHDPEIADRCASQFALQQQQQILESLESNDVDRLSKIWTSIAEKTLVDSAVTTDGHKQYVKPGHLGRAHRNLFKTTQENVPLCKKARTGDYQPLMDQCAVELRRCSKQLHRLQSLSRQLIGLHRSFNFRAFHQAQHLWETILDAKGFHRGFPTWIKTHLGLEMTIALPPWNQVDFLKDCFAEWHSANDKKAWLAKTNIKRLDIVFDLSKGGKLAFQQVKSAPLSPVTQLIETHTYRVKRTAWSKEGEKVLFGGPFRDLDPNLPVSFQDQVVDIERITERAVILKEPVRLRSASSHDFQLKQDKVLVEPFEMHRSLCSAWNVYFQRDDPSSIDRLEDHEMSLLHKIAPSNVMDLPPITGDLIKKAVISTKVSSSRGSDGFSTLDLKKLPMTLYDMLAILFQLIELQGKWPDRWTCAKTICLPKSDHTRSPYDIRPVTVMARMYRLWGKIRGKQVAQLLANIVPPEIGGPCKGVAADMIALWTSHKIERAFMEQQTLAGVVIDIVKCYNTVPRGLLLALLARLGVPSGVLQAFRAMMIQMQRFFELLQTCSDLHNTTTGIIEGCGFAIPSMLSLGILAFRVLQAEAPFCDCAFFADNWSLFANDAGHLTHGFEVLKQIVTNLSMKIAPAKSWSWATDADARKTLQLLCVDDLKVPVVFEAKDLGVQQCYSLKKCKKVLTQRINKAKSKLAVIKKAKVPRGSKKRLALGAGLSTAAYGSAINAIAPKDIHSLRVKVAQAVSRSGSGANAYLACNCVDVNLDPELRFIIQRFQLWRRFIRTFPSQKQFALDNMFALQDVPCINRKIGTLHAFVASIVLLGGLVLDIHGKISLGGVQFVWTDVSSKFLVSTIHRAWVRHVASQRIERKHFDISDFDAKGCSLAFDKLSPKDKALVDSYITGKHCTNDILSKYIPKLSPKCNLCQADDSRFHRLFECPALSKLRCGKPALKRVLKWSDANWYFGLCPAIEDVPDRWSLIDWNFPIVIPEENEFHEHVFTDGTAFFPRIQQYTLAASAFVVVDLGKFQIKSSSSSVVPGPEQNSFVAELFAICLALNSCFRAHFYTDCQAVCDLISLAVAGESFKQEIGSQSIELWRCLHAHLAARPFGAITITKVKAHVNHVLVQDPILKWQTWANNCVDHLAKNVFLIQHRTLHQKVERLYNKVVQNRKDILELYKFWALAASKCIQAEISRDKFQRVTNQFDPTLASLTFAPRGHAFALDLSREHFLSFPWGSVFLWRIVQWAKGLVWPNDGSNMGRDISFVELYIDFMLSSGSRTPRNIFDSSQRDKCGFSNYILDDIDTRADAGSIDLFQQNDVWGRSLTWLHKFLPEGLFPANIQRRSHSLTDLGCSAWYRGFDKRPTLTHKLGAAEILHRYFVTATGTHRNMKRHLDLDLKKTEPHPTWLDIDFNFRLPLMRRAKSLFQGDVT